MDWTVIGSSATVVSLMYLMLRNFKADIGKKFDKIDQRFDKVDERLEKMDQRLSRLEGSFAERGQWEGRLYSMQKTILEEKK